MNSIQREWFRCLIILCIHLMFLLCVLDLAQAQTKKEIERIIREVAEAKGFDPDLAVAIAIVESGLNPNAVGALGEIGVFQLRPEFHDVHPGNVRRNVETAIQYLIWLQTRCKDYGEAFFICFNHGPNRRVRDPIRFSYYLRVVSARSRFVATGR